MNARLVKETRSLLPTFGVLLLLIILPAMIWRADISDFPMMVFAFGCAVLGAISFGSEFQNRTLALLLAQPIARAAIWREKMLVLGVGMLVVSAATFFSVRVLSLNPMTPSETWWGALIPLVTFCTAPFLTLWTRSTLGGVVLSFTIPCLLGGVGAALSDHMSLSETTNMILTASGALVYSGLYCWLGYHQFKTFEATDLRFRELTMPAGVETFLGRQLRGISGRFISPFAVLVKKELRLQQVLLLLAGLFCVISVLGIALRVSAPKSLSTEMVLLATFFVFIGTIPFIGGAISLGEERSWGMADWQFTLPPSAQTQWLAKMLVTHATVLLLGLGLPAIIFLSAKWLAPGANLGSLPESNFELVVWTLMYFLITTVTVYAASLSSNTSRSVLLAVVLLVAASIGGWWIGAPLGRFVANVAPAPIFRDASFKSYYDVIFPWLVGAQYFILVCLLHRFAFSNFRHRDTSIRRGAAQVMTLLLFVVLTVATLEYPFQISANDNERAQQQWLKEHPAAMHSH